MRNLISLVAGAAFVAALAVPAMPAFAADVTIKGEVVELACDTSKKDAGKGDAHAACAMSCAKRGQPMAILTADAVYTITGDYAADKNAKILDFVAKQVSATGAVTEKDGVKSINVKTMAVAR
jgi:hypothetical protein